MKHSAGAGLLGLTPHWTSIDGPQNYVKKVLISSKSWTPSPKENFQNFKNSVL